MGGIEEFRGVRLAADLVNTDGGVRGRPIHLVLEPADSFDGALGAVRRAVDAGASVVIGSYGSTISAPAAETASRLDVVFWETGAVGEVGKGAAPGTRFFRAVGGGESLGQAAVAFIRDRRLRGAVGREARYSLAYVDDSYGRAVALGAEQEIEDSGLPLAGVFPYELESVDYVGLAKRIRQARTDVLVVVAYLVDGVNLRRALVAEDVPLLATIGTSSSYCHPEFGKILGEDALGLFASDKPDAGSLDPTRLSAEAGSVLRWARRNTGVATVKRCRRPRSPGLAQTGACSATSFREREASLPTAWRPPPRACGSRSGRYPAEAASGSRLRGRREQGRT